MRMRAAAVVVGLLAPGVVLAQELNTISAVTVSGDAQKATVVLVGSRRPTFQAYQQKAPVRVVVDVVKSRLKDVPGKVTPAGSLLVTEVNTSQMGTSGRELSRVEIVFAADVDYQMDADGNSLRLTASKRVDLEAQRLAKERAEAERLAKEKAENERIAKEKAEAERIAREKAENERIAKEKAENERIAREKAEAERIAREKAEAERIAREKAENERIAKEKAENERIAREKAENERIAREKAEAERIAREKAENERIAREKAENERIAREKAENERIAREKAENERLTREKAESERIAREKAEEARVARERAEATRAAQDRAAAERAAQDKAEEARVARERAEAARAAQEKAAAERAERERLDRIKADVARAEEARKASAPPGRRANEDITPVSTIPTARSAPRDNREEARPRERGAEPGFGGAPKVAQAEAEAEAAPPAAEEPPADTGGGPRVLTFVGFKNVGEQSRVITRTSDKVNYSVRKIGQNKIALELENTRITLRNNQRPLDTSFFNRTAVKLITPDETESAKAKNVRIVIELSEEVPYEAKQEGNTVYVSFQRPQG